MSISFDVKDESLSALDAARQIIAPFSEWEKEMRECIDNGGNAAMERYGRLLELYTDNDGYLINERIQREITLIGLNPEVLNRTYNTLSNGERTKLQLATMFLKRNGFLLIDEPTDHLDSEGREILENYLKGNAASYWFLMTGIL